MFFSSNECFNTLKNPVECINCNTNYCKEHIKDFQFCPNCKKEPFNYKKNAGLKKLLENHENEIIKKDKETIECKYCSFEGNPGHFCYHFAEQHKKLLIDIFGVKIEKEKNTRTLSQRNQKNQNFNFNYKTINEMKDYEKIRNNLYDRNPQSKNNKKEAKINKSYNNNIINSGKKILQNCVTQRENDFFSHNILNNNQNNNLYYCKKKNEKINCNCCLPKQICCLGNCLCVYCMKKNVELFDLKNGFLFNKARKNC